MDCIKYFILTFLLLPFFHLLYADEVKVVKNELNESEISTKSYKIHIEFPQVEGLKPEIQKNINDKIKIICNNIITDFKNTLVKDKQEKINISGSNWCNVYYEIYSGNNIFSFSFNVYKFLSVYKVPAAYTISLNFSCSSGKEISIGELFGLNSMFYDSLSFHSVKALKEWAAEDPDENQLEEIEIQNGSRSDESNFQNWNIKADKLIITFEPYHFSKKADKFIKIELPLILFKGLFDIEGPLKYLELNKETIK
jgi:hypothetical protein